MKGKIKIAIISDTHIRPEFDDGQQAFPSDAIANEKANKAVNVINDNEPNIVIHLGDIVHPIPSLETHLPAIEIAKSIFESIKKPMYYVPGNHDIGDKKGTSNAPLSNSKLINSFEENWGTLYQSFDVEDCHFIILNSIELSKNSEACAEQKTWLENDLAENDKRVFLFSHYPIFMYEPQEKDHYDNLAFENRQWLLQLIEQYKIEAVFTAHVHRFFYNHYKGTDIYSIPSTSFVRPEYANLRIASPTDEENGRADDEQTGITILTINEQGHHIEVQRVFSQSPTVNVKQKNLGVWLHHPLGRTTEIPYGDLDLLVRKRARNDIDLLYIKELGLNSIRIPLQDLENEDVILRVKWLAKQNIQTIFFGNTFISKENTNKIASLNALYEFVAKDDEVEAVANWMENQNSEHFIISRIGKPFGNQDNNYHSHFPRTGFEIRNPEVLALLISFAEKKFKNVAFRKDPASDSLVFQKISEYCDTFKLKAFFHIELPWLDESKVQRNDELIEEHVNLAAIISADYPQHQFLLDQLYDKDRGYWCKNGLISLSDEPRPAFNSLKKL